MVIHIKTKKKYILFTKGKGEMQVDDERFPVKDGDIVLVEKGEFHRVFNTSHLGLLLFVYFKV